VWGGNDFGADLRLPYPARHRMLIGTEAAGRVATFHYHVSPFSSYVHTAEDAQDLLRRGCLYLARKPSRT
jgi:hypothetical protein